MYAGLSAVDDGIFKQKSLSCFPALSSMSLLSQCNYPVTDSAHQVFRVGEEGAEQFN